MNSSHRKTTLLLIIVLFITGTTQIGYGQGISTEKLNAYFDTLEANNKYMGSAAILKDGKIVYNKQAGYANIESKRNPDNKTKYRIGSISKVFTATLIFKAIEDGKISLDEKLDTYFSEIQNADVITISNLLNHRSGIHNYTDNKKEFLSYHTKAKTAKEMVTIIAKGGSDFTPNEQASYSNSNYVLLSYILEKLYNKPYRMILQDEITGPLHLNNTYFGSKINMNNNESYAYRFKNKWKKTDETDPSIDLGAGGIVSTPIDLVRFAEALFNNELLSVESVQKMKTIQDEFGMGLFKTEYYDKVSYGHNGEIDGFVSVLRYFPDENIGFAIISNGSNYSMNSVAVTLVNSIFDKYYDIPDLRVYKPKSKELDDYLGVYSSTTFPVKLTVTKSDNNLFVQAPGDAKMTLQATAKGEFKYEPAGITIVFMAEKDHMQLTQRGKTTVLYKE